MQNNLLFIKVFLLDFFGTYDQFLLMWHVWLYKCCWLNTFIIEFIIKLVNIYIRWHMMIVQMLLGEHFYDCTNVDHDSFLHKFCLSKWRKIEY